MFNNICVLGGTGFVGHHLVSRLAAARYQVKVLTHRRERHRDLLVLPTVKLVEADVHNPRVLAREFADQHAVINLVGILNEKRDNGRGFRHAHTELAEKVIHACQQNGVKRLLHMSALHADAQRGASYYLKTKGEAEDLVHAAEGIHVTSFRPSVVFGPGDSFFNRFYSLLKLAPVLPLACGDSKFAPVFVGDVAEAFAKSLRDPDTYGQRYDLCGPEQYTLKQLVEYTARTAALTRKVLGLGPGLSRLMANVFQYTPFFKPITRDNFRSLQVNSVCSGPFPEVFGITPTGIDEVVPSYLGHTNYRNRYQQYRQHYPQT
jgi:NADH dehydrogenase